jgi:hypothetical protein
MSDNRYSDTQELSNITQIWHKIWRIWGNQSEQQFGTLTAQELSLQLESKTEPYDVSGSSRLQIFHPHFSRKN